MLKTDSEEDGERSIELRNSKAKLNEHREEILKILENLLHIERNAQSDAKKLFTNTKSNLLGSLLILKARLYTIAFRHEDYYGKTKSSRKLIKYARNGYDTLQTQTTLSRL